MAAHPDRLQVKFGIEPRGGHLLAELNGRETAADMRAFVLAVRLASRQHGCMRILVSVRASRPLFKAEDYGLSGASHLNVRSFRDQAAAEWLEAAPDIPLDSSSSSAIRPD